ncbi:MAG: hypothetical protein APF81_08090 [Desulfosporosinus sp. BRH_c37]|nr:MAG: hypothetical protein APF81_08090 [Desulfosporosinus sp. BRH_c37]
MIRLIGHRESTAWMPFLPTHGILAFLTQTFRLWLFESIRGRRFARVAAVFIDLVLQFFNALF